MTQAAGDNRDVHARRPTQISLRGWKSVGKRVVQQIGFDHLAIIAAGVAFNIFLALFPLVIAVISIYGLIIDPQTVQGHLSAMTGVMPEEAQRLLDQQMRGLAQANAQALGWGLLVSVAVSLWAANRGTKALFEGINIAYNSDKQRGFLVKNALTLLFTLGGLLFGGVSLAMLIGIPALAGVLPLPDFLIRALQLAVWPLLFFLIIIALGLLYKVAPVRSNPRVKWVSVGSVVAALIWLAGSGLFSYFVANFANYNKTYGSLAAVVVLMLWLFLTSFIVLLGAETNAEIERQTAEDTTVGRDKPMGQRGAYHADRVADQ